MVGGSCSRGCEADWRYSPSGQTTLLARSRRRGVGAVPVARLVRWTWIGMSRVPSMELSVGSRIGDLRQLDPQFVSEADLKRTVRRALQMQLGPSVLPEGARSFRLEDWPGRLMSPEILIRHPTEAGQRAFVELKWCREDKMFEVLWDLLKLSLAAALTASRRPISLSSASGRAWSDPGWTCSALLSNDEWSTRDLFSLRTRLELPAGRQQDGTPDPTPRGSWH